MRKNTKTARRDATRTVKVFLFWPRTIKYERRWLEWAIIEQRYIVGVNHCAWMDERWLTEGEWMRKKTLGIINDHADGMSRIFEEMAGEVRE